MKKIFAILATAVLMLTILTSLVAAVGGVPEIEVTKTVRNETADPWEDSIRANVSDTVQFNSTIHNSGSCNLTNITVTDTLSDSLEFVDAEPYPEGVCYDCPLGTGNTVLTWFLSGPLAPSNKRTFLINATVIKCGVDTNTQYAEAEGGGETVSDEATATVYVPGEPEIEVTKTVWNETSGDWEDNTTATLGDSVQFRCEIHNDGTCDDCDLTNIEVTDTLSKSLEYTSADPEPDDVTHNPDGTTVLTWSLPDPLARYNTETFLINVTVIECGVDTNTQNATAECCGDIVSGEDNATVNVLEVPGIEVVKTVWDGTAWVDEITANLNDIVEFNVTVHNNGTCCDLWNINVIDLLPDSFEFINWSVKGDTLGPDRVDYTKQGVTLGWFFSGPLAPCETMTYMITARVIECGVAENKALTDAEPECIAGKVYDEDIATVNVLGEPGIEVNKTVWNNESKTWEKEITANVSDTVQFNSTIHNSGTCCNLTDIEVTDTLSDSFNYTSAYPEPNCEIHNPDGTTTLTWFLPGPLAPCNSTTFIINVTVTKCGVDTNTQYAEAEGCGEIVSGEATATVIVPGEPGMDVNKTVLNETSGDWEDNITANLGDIVQFKSTIHNNGTCCDLTSINVTDTLSRSLEYISAEPEPDGVCYDCPPGTNKTVLTWFLPDPLAPGETKAFLINAKVIECGVDNNTQNATAESCGQNLSDEATATVFVPRKPSIEVNKTVRDPETGEWVDNITVNLNDTVRFRCDSDSLEYNDSATVQYPNGTTVPMEPNGVGLEWLFPDLVLLHCETLTIEFDARVVKCGVDTNIQYAEAVSPECGAIVDDEDTATVNVRGVPGMKVNKTVSNGTAWVKEITAKLNDTVKFNSTIYNTGTCCNLTNMTVWDILSDSLEYLNATPEPDKVIYYPNGTTKIIWFPGVFAPCRPVPPDKSTTFIINVTVIKCGGVDTNTQYAEAVSCGEVLSEQDSATVYVPGVPEIEVNKTVRNETGPWEDRINANVSDTVRFRCEIHNNGTCCPLTDIVVTDELSNSLEYADNATVNGEPWEPIFVNPNKFVWEFPEWVLEHCETITIEFDARVVNCGVDNNTQNATAVGCGIRVSDSDTATVDATGEAKPGIEVEKTVLDPDTGEWVDKINASIGDTVKFNSTIHNNGTCCNLTDINVTDTLSDSLEYSGVQGDTPAPNCVIHNPDGTTTLTWFFSGPLVPCETITLLIDANVTKSGEDWNKQNATADACGTWVSDEDYAYVVSALLKPDLVITDKWLCWPDNCTICYNVANIGEGVAVAHDHVPVDLAPGESYIGCFDGYVWAYTPPSDNITVCADNNKTRDELHEDNNCLTNIWLCGDVNCDGNVTMSDVRKVYSRYLDPDYQLDLPWAADVNCDGNVTMSDVRKVYSRYLDPEYDLNCCCEVVG
jgi:uncharacterized repeat protein (TIGR01451 family)